MRPWSEVYEDLRTLWHAHWRLNMYATANGRKILRLSNAIQRVTREIVLRDQRIRELEAKVRELEERNKS